jgi:tRNA(Arg) A34 adenosine deaminase TadA
MSATAVIATALPLLRARPAHANTADEIIQPTRATPEAYIERAFELRDQAVDSGDQAYGAAVVKDGRIIGQSQSLVVLDDDPSAHAEMSAIRDAARRVGRRGLRGATLYSSSRPCPMCEAAAFWAGFEGFHFGRGIEAGGAPRLCG